MYTILGGGILKKKKGNLILFELIIRLDDRNFNNIKLQYFQKYKKLLKTKKFTKYSFI